MTRGERVMQTKAYTFRRPQALEVARRVAQAQTPYEAIEGIKSALRDLPKAGPGHTWRMWGERLLQYLEGSSDKPTFEIIRAEGNAKLPFFCFSVVPIFMCPGVGECAEYCYSLTGWRHAGAFWRQIQNTFLIKFYPDKVADAFLDLPRSVDFRLYVDGDFHNVWAVGFWFKLFRLRPDVKAYGYSKSWDELLAYEGPDPTNYLLNISNGGKVRNVTLDEVRKLSYVRGNFIAVDIPKGAIKGRSMEEKFAGKEYHDAVRQAGGDLGLRKTFSCRGFCGSCVKDTDGGNSHACGDKRFIDINILIGKH